MGQTLRKISYQQLRKYSSSTKKWSYYHQPGSHSLLGITLGEVLTHTALKYADVPAIISVKQGVILSFSELKQNADRLAAALLKLGLKKGDYIGIWCTNKVEWEITSLAVARIGCVLVQLSPGYLASDIKYSVNKVNMKALICDVGLRQIKFYDILNELGDLEKMDPENVHFDSMPSLKHIIFIDENLKKGGAYCFNEILENVNEKEIKSIENNQNLIQIDDPLSVQFTSGTTGKPKATMLTHHNVVNNSFCFAHRFELFKKNYSILVQVPFFHAFGATAALACSLHYGTTLVLPDNVYNPPQHIRVLADYKCDIIYGTPTMYIDLVNEQQSQRLDITPEIAAIGAAPGTRVLTEDIFKILKVSTVVNLYGLTECTAICMQSYLTDPIEKTIGMAGHIGDHIEIKIIDQNGYIVPIGTSGEICVRGYSVMSGYYGDKTSTDEAITKEGWLRTGDSGIITEEGYGKIVGRIKDMIIRGGENVFPKEVEDFLITHPDIMDVQVIGLPHKRLGEQVCACAIIRKGSTLTLEDIAKFCKDKLAFYKTPSKFYVVKQFPKTPSGKIQKHILREQIIEIMIQSGEEV